MSWWAVGAAAQRATGRLTSPTSSTSCVPAEPSCPTATVNSRRPPGHRRWNPLFAARVRVCLGTPDMSQSAIARRKASGTATIQRAHRLRRSARDDHRLARPRTGVCQPRRARPTNRRPAGRATAARTGDASGSDHRVHRHERRHPARTVFRTCPRRPRHAAHAVGPIRRHGRDDNVPGPRADPADRTRSRVAGRTDQRRNQDGRRTARISARRPLRRAVDGGPGDLEPGPHPWIDQGPHPVRRRGGRGARSSRQQP